MSAHLECATAIEHAADCRIGFRVRQACCGGRNRCRHRQRGLNEGEPLRLRERNRGLRHNCCKDRENTTPRKNRSYPLSHRSHPWLKVWRLLRVRNGRRTCASMLCGQGNIEHKTTPVKKQRALFCPSNVACAVCPLQVAPTEVQGPDYTLHSVRITRRDSDARPCSRGHDRCEVDDVVVSPATIGTNIHGARAVQKCQLSGIVPPEIPARHVDRLTRKKSIRWSKIRTCSATGLRKHFKNRSRRDQSLRAVTITKGMRLEDPGAWGNAPDTYRYSA